MSLSLIKTYNKFLIIGVQEEITGCKREESNTKCGDDTQLSYSIKTNADLFV